jgi:hypothetical protein
MYSDLPYVIVLPEGFDFYNYITHDTNLLDSL